MIEQCSNCRYWHQTGNTEVGVCRRFPPKIIKESEISRWPITPADQSCGEWKKIKSN